MKKRDVLKILFLITFWELCTIFITYYDASLVGFKSEIGGEHYSFMHTLITNVINCLIGASILGSLEILVLGKLLRKKPLGISLLIKTTIYIMFILFFTSAGTLYLYSSEIAKPMFSDEVFQLYGRYYLSARVFSVIMFWGVACMLALFILQINEKFGQGVLVNFLLGKYHRPKVEKRIFMFLDLTSSTTYAEKLGHIKYSQLLQDCFYDLTDIVVKHDAQVYQYVGDEVVLTWESRKGIKNNKCVSTFFEYDSVIRQRGDHYQEKYGVLPEFKAALNLGHVTVAEVGEIKKELAYHGDALNTAARIRSVCSEVRKRLLIAAELLSVLPEIDRDFSVESLGMSRLRGKKNVVGLFSIERKDNL